MPLDHRTMLSVRRHRILKASLAGVAAVALAVVAPIVVSASSRAASAATVPTHYLTPNGGTVTWTVTVHNAKPA
jgi:tryptophan-rich sensory protein